MCDVGIYFYFSNYDLLIAFGLNTDVSKRKKVAVALEIIGLRASFIDLSVIPVWEDTGVFPEEALYHIFSFGSGL